MGAPSRVLPIFAPDCHLHALAERTYVQWILSESVVSGGVSAKVTLLGVCTAVRGGDGSGEGERASGAVHAGRRGCTSQDLGAAGLGARTGLSASSCVGAASGVGGTAGGGNGAG
eukprot:2765485-Amphidinium_carterae.1